MSHSLGRLCREVNDTVCDVFGPEIDGDSGVPAIVGTVQTFGDLVHWHPHIHAIVAAGVFTENGHFHPHIRHLADCPHRSAGCLWIDPRLRIHFGKLSAGFQENCV